MRENALDRLRAAGEPLLEELAREEYRALAGHQPEAALQAVYARHPSASGAAALEAAREGWREAPDDAARVAARKLLEWQVDMAVGRAVAPLEEREIAWQASAAATLTDGRVLPYGAIPAALANARDRDDRLRIAAARAELVARELAPLRRERLLREREVAGELEFADDYVATVEVVSGLALEPLAERCRTFLRDTEAMWDDVRPTFLRRAGVPAREAVRADALAVARASEFDGGFPAADLIPAVRRMLGDAGVDPDAGGRIRYDLEERPGKRARAFCAPVRVPEEVYLVLRPQGGADDWKTLLHELGHALHFAHARASLPFEDRRLGDTSVTEGYAMLLDHLVMDPGWLRRYTSLPADRLRDWRAHAAFVELHLLRRYCAKLLYELTLWGEGLQAGSAPEAYVEILTTGTGFRYDAADAYVDVDPRFYVARYLRAWMLQASLAATLRERFDEDWFRNPACGAFLVTELFALGQREDADELAARVTGGELSFLPLVGELEARLA